MSAEAHEAWNRKFPTRHLELARNDTRPFSLGVSLGRGGYGVVYKTYIDGHPLALKAAFSLRMTTELLNEIKILGRISAERHHHIIEMVGSYIHPQRKGYEIGILMWPLAHTDLAAVLRDIHALNRCMHTVNTSATMSTKEETLRIATEPLLFVLSDSAGSKYNTEDKAVIVMIEVGLRLQRSIGCMAEAINYLHSQGIRHKDLKPSQILLLPDGLRLTDFGWSRDMSEYDRSTTTGLENITLKYQAPERATGARCGLPEDIFSLGCVFLEMVYAMATMHMPSTTLLPWMERGWAFCDNLPYLKVWMHPFLQLYLPSDHCGILLMEMIASMLSFDTRRRPSIDVVLDELLRHGSEAMPNKYGPNKLFGRCCHRQVRGPLWLLPPPPTTTRPTEDKRLNRDFGEMLIDAPSLDESGYESASSTMAQSGD